MEFEWDPAKREANLAKHGVDLADATELNWKTVKFVPDLRRDYGEPRFIGYGLLRGLLYVVAFTEREGVIRIISMRRANDREVKRYGTPQN